MCDKPEFCFVSVSTDPLGNIWPGNKRRRWITIRSGLTMVVAQPNNTTTGASNLAKKSNLKFVLRNNRKAEPFAVTNTLKKVTIINNNFSPDDEVRKGWLLVARMWHESLLILLFLYRCLTCLRRSFQASLGQDQ